MNTLKGLGACAVLAGIAFTVTKVATVDQLMLGVTVAIVVVCLATYAASIRRRRRDRRMANGRIRSRGLTS